MRKEQGIWVFTAGEPLSASTVGETIAEARRERDRRNLTTNTKRTGEKGGVSHRQLKCSGSG
jgi:hypothetical protein